LDAELKRLALTDSVRLFGRLAAENDSLRRFAASAPLNTDDHPRVVFEAPRRTQGAVLSLRRLAGLLVKWREGNVATALGLHGETGFARRVERFRQARDEFVLGQIADAEGDRAGAIEHYVKSAEQSEDFTAGYAQCLSWAASLARSRPGEARVLLERLAKAQPHRTAAREMLERLEELR
jgi:spermidine synthase